MTCQHCNRHKASQRRGLCEKCYWRPGVRELYERIRPLAYRSPVGNKDPKRLPEPTTHLPGSPAKVLVLEDRAKNREALWHPQDAPQGE